MMARKVEKVEEVDSDEEWRIDTYSNDRGPEDEDQPLLVLEDVARYTPGGQDPLYSAFGYVIAEDGGIYSLNEQWHHGIVLAILHPELLDKFKYDRPRRHANVFKYQRFEFAVQDSLPYIFIGYGMSGFNIYKGGAPATTEQILSVLRCFVEIGVSGDSLITCGSGEIEANDVEKYLKKDERRGHHG